MHRYSKRKSASKRVIFEIQCSGVEQANQLLQKGWILTRVDSPTPDNPSFTYLFKRPMLIRPKIHQKLN